MSASDVPLKRSPLLGEHTNDILSDDLGLDATDLQELEAAGIVGGPPVIGAK